MEDLLGNAPRKEEALWGLLPHSFRRTAGCEGEGVSQGQMLPLWASLRAPEAWASLSSSWERLQRETPGCPGKGGWGRPAGPVLGRSCPFLGRPLMQDPTPIPPLPCALPSCFRQLQPDSLEGPVGGDCGLIRIRARGCRLASLGAQPVCFTRTPSQTPHQPLQEAC